MISTKIVTILVAAAFVSGAFISSPDIRAYAANTIASIDIINETIRSEDIKNGQVKANDIAQGAVNSAKIKDGDVMTIDIADNAVTSDKLADNIFDGLQDQIDTLAAENAAQATAIDVLTGRVEALESGGTADPDDVDDDADGFTENQGDCNDADAAVNPDATEDVNGIDDNCDGAFDNVPDAFEPNESLVEAADIGEAVQHFDGQFGFPIMIEARMHDAADEDWYTATATESIFTDSEHDADMVIRVFLEDIPLGSNYDLYVTCPDCIDPSTKSSTQAGNQFEIVTLQAEDTPAPPLTAQNDSVILQIEVRNLSNIPENGEYTLSVIVDDV